MDALACALISIHAPTRGATTGQYGYANWKNDFNPRSYKRSDMPTVHSQPFMSDFNPRSYKRSDKLKGLVNRRSKISIHAPTRGATPAIFDKTTGEQFQSTLLQEERPSTHRLININQTISIHAPTRGATAKMHNYPYTYL